MTSEKKIPLILQILIFLIPVNIYVIGDWLGTGIQFLFFRYQQTNLGNGFILLNREIYFVFSGILKGRSAFSTIFFTAGVACIIIATVLILYGYMQEEPGYRKSAIINCAAALAFVIAVFLQYGIFLHGPSGIDIPFGIPIILIIAIWQYRLSSAFTAESETAADTI